MSFDRLALAIAKVDLAKVSEIELVRIIRASVNEGMEANPINKVTLSTGLVIAKALKQAHFKGKDQAIRFIAEGY